MFQAGRRSGFCGVMVGLVLLVGSLPASAQDGGQRWAFAEPSRPQLELYEAGADAFKKGQWEHAAEFFRASLALGELNLTWLNLGRTHHKAGRCQEAREAYDKVGGAPSLETPSPQQVAAKLGQWRQELEVDCPASAPALEGAVAEVTPSEVVGEGRDALHVALSASSAEARQAREPFTASRSAVPTSLNQKRSPGGGELLLESGALDRKHSEVMAAALAVQDDESDGISAASWGGIFLMLGGSTLAAGGIFAREASHHVSEFNSSGSRSARNRARRDHETSRDISNGLFVTTGVLAGTALICFLVHASGSVSDLSDQQSSSQDAINVSVTPQGVMLDGRW